ncbi:DUF4257 domain-containing protein [Cytobacillus sp. FSL W7-1323]|uniref:DUF4257 domain-containing protein n=1 Tax=Cytobacillus TaxID=2675230 RepID=UPI001CD7AE9A|nr:MULTISPECIES: DUF4257 domain-containing protein [Cytobacillus]MCA1025764.1 DUF4257 domain-containing protein [Cytobacillus kochii]MCM3321612.1 DUF4257 domain-containing protein [Cytobacillus kochii]MCM3343554.1 DUF4257 domain-containing protein [Cytobacillus kochii]MDM5207385.1 DUF4257 domain-containing protein [Cytobacillus kochii]MDQ0184726.1 hypothetical protein [Cytobacillus kochii]
MLMNILFAALIGGIVGVAGHLQRLGKLVKPRMTKKFIYLGFLEDILLGGLAAVFVIVTTTPDSPTAVFIISLVSGMGGEGILKLLDTLKVKDQE